MNATITAPRTALQIAQNPRIAVGDLVRIGARGKVEYRVAERLTPSPYAGIPDGTVIIERTDGHGGRKTIDTERLFLIYPDVQPEELGSLVLRFNEGECGRCGGSGRYGYNSVYGNRCFGCSGRGMVITYAGERARKIADEIQAAMETPVDQIKVGDRIRWVGKSGRRTWRDVHAVEDTGLTSSYTAGVEGSPHYEHKTGTSILITTRVTYKDRPDVEVAESVHMPSYGTVRVRSAQVIADSWTAALRSGGCSLEPKAR